MEKSAAVRARLSRQITTCRHLANAYHLMAMADSPDTKHCALCDQPISLARLEALPGVTTCIACARKHPVKYDTRQIEIAQASPINRNGFAPSE